MKQTYINTIREACCKKIPDIYDEEVDEIFGQGDIGIAEILIAANHQVEHISAFVDLKNTRVEFQAFWNTNKSYYYDLKNDSIELQSEETLKFLSELLNNE